MEMFCIDQTLNFFSFFILTVSVVNPDVISVLPVKEVSIKVNVWLIWKIISSWESNILCALIIVNIEAILDAK